MRNEKPQTPFNQDIELKLCNLRVSPVSECTSWPTVFTWNWQFSLQHCSLLGYSMGNRTWLSHVSELGTDGGYMATGIHNKLNMQLKANITKGCWIPAHGIDCLSVDIIYTVVSICMVFSHSSITCFSPKAVMHFLMSLNDWLFMILTLAN